MDEREGSSAAFEAKKLEIEMKKLKIERIKAWVTMPSLLASFLAILVTVNLSAKSEENRARSEQEKAQTEFALKAADTILATHDPYEMKGRARIIKIFFPNRLPEGFGENFDEKRFAVPLYPDEKFLLQMIIEHRDQKQEIIKMWEQMYPEDDRVKKLKE